MSLVEGLVRELWNYREFFVHWITCYSSLGGAGTIAENNDCILVTFKYDIIPNETIWIVNGIALIDSNLIPDYKHAHFL